MQTCCCSLAGTAACQSCMARRFYGQPFHQINTPTIPMPSYQPYQPEQFGKMMRLSDADMGKLADMIAERLKK